MAHLIYKSHVGKTNSDVVVYRSRRNVHFAVPVRTLSQMVVTPVIRTSNAIAYNGWIGTVKLISATPLNIR